MSTAQLRVPLAAALLGLGVAACGVPALEAKAKELEKRIAALEGKLAENEKTMEQVRASLEFLALRVLVLENGEEAALSCTEQGYSFVPTQLGKFMISCDDLKPFGDGYKVTLRVGNPHFVTLNGVKLTVRYGPRMPQAAGSGPQRVAWDEWQHSVREKSVDLNNVLLPAAWNRVDVVLAPAKAEEVGFIGVKMVVDKLTLRR